MEYDGLFDFQLCLYKMFGRPVNGDPKVVQLPSERVVDFFSSVKRMGGNICFDVGAAASQSIDEVVSHKSRVLMLGKSGSDYLESIFVPDGLKVIIDKDPRESYALVHCRPNSNECRVGIREKPVAGPNEVLVYPNGSSLMAKTSVSSGRPFQEFSVTDDWIDIVFARIYTKVLGDLQRHYGHARFFNVDSDAIAPVEWTSDYVTGTNFGHFNFRVERTEGMKNKHLESWIKLFLEKNLPFTTHLWCKPVPNKRMVDVSVLVEIP